MPQASKPEGQLPASGTITAIEEQKRRPHRRSVFVDGEFLLGLDREVIFLLGLKVGQQVDRATLQRAALEEEWKRAKDDALAFLSAQARTRKQVADKLLRRGYESETVERVLGLLTEYQWVDDAAFTKSFARSRATARKPVGKRRLVQELRQKGVAPETIREHIGEALAGVDPLEEASRAAADRLRRLTRVDRAAAQRRLMGFLQRQGYDFDTVRQAVQRAMAGWQDPGADDDLGGGEGEPFDSDWE